MPCWLNTSNLHHGGWERAPAVRSVGSLLDLSMSSYFASQDWQRANSGWCHLAQLAERIERTREKLKELSIGPHFINFFRSREIAAAGWRSEGMSVSGREHHQASRIQLGFGFSRRWGGSANLVSCKSIIEGALGSPNYTESLLEVLWGLLHKMWCVVQL